MTWGGTYLKNSKLEGVLRNQRRGGKAREPRLWGRAAGAYRRKGNRNYQQWPLCRQDQRHRGKGHQSFTHPASPELVGGLHRPLYPQLPGLWFLLLVYPPPLPSGTHR